MRRSTIKLLVLFSIMVLLLVPYQASFADDARILGGYCEIIGDEVRYTLQLRIWDMRNEDVVVNVFPVNRQTDNYIRYGGLNTRSLYRSVEGYLVGSQTVTPGFNVTDYSALVIRIPISAFPRGTYGFYPYFEVQRARDHVLIRWQSHKNCTLSSASF